MRDCENVEVRDSLPDLLHERLVAAQRDMVVAHVDTCVDCAEELALLRAALRASSSRTPRVDVAAIASGVLARVHVAETPVVDPKVVPLRARPSRWASPYLRVAAAAVAMVLGTTVVMRARAPESSSATGVTAPTAAPTLAQAAPDSHAVVATPLAAAVESTPRAESVATARPRTEAALGASFGDLSDDELAAVLAAIEGPDALPPAEPAPTPALVTSGDML